MQERKLKSNMCQYGSYTFECVTLRPQFVFPAKPTNIFPCLFIVADDPRF